LHLRVPLRHVSPNSDDMRRRQMLQRLRAMHRQMQQMQSLLHRMTVQRPVTRPPASAG